MQRRHFDQLASPESWQSPVSVIAHIDLDAFYAQCLTVRYNLDPKEPLGCRQWNSLIAINYPAREYGLKRGINVDEARKLCPKIHLPHVATFKKGEIEWKFHTDPDPYNYKVSLDSFRRESRRIFGVFKRHFRMVEKAGIDEGFVDLGPEIHRQFKLTRPELFNTDNETVDITYEQLLDVGATLVNSVREEIHKELHYTCSAGIASNKLLAKLGSQYQKPANQTVVYPEEIPKFLANFKITDAWGWGGKHGKEVLHALDIDENDTELDQCKYVRENFSLTDLERKLGDFQRARRVYDLVRGEEVSEVKPRTLTKSLVAVKNFTTGVPIQTTVDLDMWLRVFAADLAGRVADIQEDFGGIIAPKTIGVKFHANKAMHSKQQPFDGSGMDIDQFREQIYIQARAVGQNFLPIPCRYLVVEIAGLAPLPKERLMFQKTSREKVNEQLKNLGKEPSKLSEASLMKDRSEVGIKNPLNRRPRDKTKDSPIREMFSRVRSQSPTPKACVQEEPSPAGEQLFVDDEPLFVDDDDVPIVCPRCQASIEPKQQQEHDDWHYAKDLQEKDIALSRPSTISPPKRKAESAKSKPKKRDHNQQSILQFFKK